jgi:hypothetical protein
MYKLFIFMCGWASISNFALYPGEKIFDLLSAADGFVGQLQLLCVLPMGFSVQQQPKQMQIAEASRRSAVNRRTSACMHDGHRTGTWQWHWHGGTDRGADCKVQAAKHLTRASVALCCTCTSLYMYIIL